MQALSEDGNVSHTRSPLALLRTVALQVRSDQEGRLGRVLLRAAVMTEGPSDKALQSLQGTRRVPSDLQG